MNNKLSYIEEGNVEKKFSLLTLFIIIVLLITIGIIIFTGILAFKIINKNKNNSDSEMQAQTIGLPEDKKEVKSNKNEKRENNKEKKSEAEIKQENVTQTSFPEHDINVAFESQLPQYSEQIAQKVVDVYFEKTKKVYLTFDDGPTDRTTEILDILKEYDVKATFFVLGSNVDIRPELAKRAYEEGHFIADHSYTHQYSKIYQSPEEVLNEYNQTLTSIQNAIGVPNYNPHLFRFPGGSSGGRYDSVKRQAIQLLRENGITNTNWNCLSGDAEGCDTIEKMWNMVNETAAGDDNLVILMHDAADKQVTVEFLPQLIEKYQAEGYEFCNYYDVMCE